jgi:hypothetical protein
VRAVVRDYGEWRDPDATRDGKRGLVLMHGVADVDVMTGPAGTTVQLVRTLRAGVR